MASDQQITQDGPLYPNAEKVGDFIESEPDAAVRSLMRLVYGEFLMAILDGRRPDGNLDLLYCFETLKKAFCRKDALEEALKGNYGDPHADIEWT